ncbi:MAG: hypothetical protein ACLQM8_00420 [Limisphaerales bacterium]
MSVSSTDKGSLTPENSAVIFLDYQPQMSFAAANIDRQDLLNNALLLARAAKIFGVPVMLTAVEAGGFRGNITPQLLEFQRDWARRGHYDEIGSWSEHIPTGRSTNPTLAREALADLDRLFAAWRRRPRMPCSVFECTA